jgi:hypothetical protein
VIGAAAFCPHPPALVPEISQGAAPEFADLVAACRRAIRTVATPERRLVLLGPGAEPGSYPATAWGSLARYGVRVEVSLGGAPEGAPELPLSLTVGAWLVRDALGDEVSAIGFAVGSGWQQSAAAVQWAQLCRADEPTALIVLGDGSGWRNAVAPGRLGERAAGIDSAVAAALASGDPARLAVEPVEAAELIVGGVPAWHEAARSLGGRQWSARLEYDAAPFGVGYFVATWT